MKNSKLTKDLLFRHTTAENIYLQFLGLSQLPKKNSSSPFSEDKNPSFNLYTHNGTLKFKCFSSGYQGNVFDFVGYLNGLDPQDKTQFKEILHLIAQEMDVPMEENTVPVAKKIKPVAVNHTLEKPNEINHFELLQPKEQPQLQENGQLVATEKKPSKLQVKIRAFTKLDLAYWDNLGVNRAVLEKYKVHSISESFFETDKPFKTKENTISFAYQVDGCYKKYTPEQPSFGVKKVLMPHLENTIFGLEQLGTTRKENIIICEGEKDVLVAVSHGFFAVTLGSATIMPTTSQIGKLQSLCDNLLLCYDNDNAGITGRCAISNQFPNIIPLQLPQNENIKGYDIADYFQEYSSADFQTMIEVALNNKKRTTSSTSAIPIQDASSSDATIFHKAENYLSKHYDIRFDTIANEIEISKKNQNQWEEINENSLYVAMQKKHIKISIGNLKAILSSDYVPKFDPLRHYFESLPLWDKKTDYIKALLDYVELEAGEDREQFIYHFRKWCVRAVKCATLDHYFNKQAFVLSDDAKGQSIGKTTFIRHLVPQALNKYYCENLPEDKDALKRLGQNFIINLDELATLSRTDINKLKSMFSSDKIKTRLPYGAKDVILSRVANFIGSTNMSTFLVDESGSVRWLCFIVKKIDFGYSSTFNIDQLWAQAFALSKDEHFKEFMTKEDIAKNEIRNDKFQIVSCERELIPKYFDVPRSEEQATHLTATEILNHIALWTSGVRLTVGAIGKAMPKCGFTRKKYKDSYGYWVLLKPII
jgi:predicted P-loop ATPase